jgi:hypothetical protein
MVVPSVYSHRSSPAKYSFHQVDANKTRPSGTQGLYWQFQTILSIELAIESDQALFAPSQERLPDPLEEAKNRVGSVEQPGVYSGGRIATGQRVPCWKRWFDPLVCETNVSMAGNRKTGRCSEPHISQRYNYSVFFYGILLITLCRLGHQPVMKLVLSLRGCNRQNKFPLT